MFKLPLPLDSPDPSSQICSHRITVQGSIARSAWRMELSSLGPLVAKQGHPFPNP